jgi:hypothetical protein
MIAGVLRSIVDLEAETIAEPVLIDFLLELHYISFFYKPAMDTNAKFELREIPNVVEIRFSRMLHRHNGVQPCQESSLRHVVYDKQCCPQIFCSPQTPFYGHNS